MKSPISLTNKAIQKIKQLTINSNKFALRLDLKKGGCAGMEYFMEYVDKVEQNEEVIDFDGAKLSCSTCSNVSFWNNNRL